MDVLVFTGGRYPRPSDTVPYFKRNSFGLVIAADSGLEAAAAYGIEPDFALGDMDSLCDKSLLERLPPERVLRYGRDKDFSDTELALMRAREFAGEKGRVTLVGADGGRLDHLLAAYDTFCEPFHADVWLCEHSAAYLLPRGSRGFIRGLAAGGGVSFSRLSNSRTEGRIISHGLVWPQFREAGFPSLSNRVRAESCGAEFFVEEGDFLAIMGHEGFVEFY